jgi:serine/threonine protein kinase
MVDPNTPPSLENYIIKSKVGKGSFATVWLAEHRFAKIDVAIKVVDHAEIDSDDLRTRFIREINLIKQMDHPFIAKLFEVITTEKHTYLVMEFAAKGSILDFINESGRLLEGPARSYFGQVIAALEYLHEVRRVAHRDLKAENVLLDRHGNLRLIDFGLSNAITQETGSFKSQCGSPAYCAPEMIMGRPYTKSADLWSAGVLLYALVIGELPFQDSQLQRLLHKIAYSDPEYPEFLSPQLVDLLQKVLTKQPDSRLTLQGIKSHPWFSNSEYSRILNMPFSGDQLLVHGIDRELVDRIAGMGIDVKPLTQALLQRVQRFDSDLPDSAEGPDDRSCVRSPSGDYSIFARPIQHGQYSSSCTSKSRETGRTPNTREKIVMRKAKCSGGSASDTTKSEGHCASDEETRWIQNVTAHDEGGRSRRHRALGHLPCIHH